MFAQRTEEDPKSKVLCDSGKIVLEVTNPTIISGLPDSPVALPVNPPLNDPLKRLAVATPVILMVLPFSCEIVEILPLDWLIDVT